MNTRKAAVFLGLAASLASLFLWITFAFFNPYSDATELSSIAMTFMMLCLPAFLVIFAIIKSKSIYLLVAFIWSLPLSIYLAWTPGIFALFGTTSVLYLISYIFMKNTVPTKIES